MGPFEMAQQAQAVMAKLQAAAPKLLALQSKWDSQRPGLQSAAAGDVALLALLDFADTIIAAIPMKPPGA